MKKLISIVLLCVSASIFGQQDEIPDIASDITETNVEAKIYSYIAKQAEPDFISQHLNVNDSIEFPVYIEVASGQVVRSKTKVSTEYAFFNRYFEVIINQMPPLSGVPSDFVITATPQFTVTAEHKLKSLFSKESPAGIQMGYAMSAVFPDCDAAATASQRKKCFSEKLNLYVASNVHFKKATPGRMIVSFSVTTDGSITNVKVLRDAGPGTAAEVERAFARLPKLQPALDSLGRPVASSYTLPIVVGPR